MRLTGKDFLTSERMQPKVTAPIRFPRFFVTSPAPCPYLPGKSERKVFTELRGDNADELNEALGQLPINNQSKVGDDPFLQAGFEMLSTADGGIAQFFDRDAPAEMAKVGMEGFQEVMVKPENVDKILERLEKARKRIYK